MNVQGLYGYLKSHEQWYLHDFFQPSKEWSDSQLLQHREAITEQRPSLPHQAGRALAKLQAHAVQYAVNRVRAPALSRSRKRGRGVVTVRAVVRPEIDVHKLARALIAMEQAKIREQIEQTDAFIKELDDWIDDELTQAS